MIRLLCRRALLVLVLSLGLGFGSTPAWASVTITFWSHEFGSSFPHAFVSMRGTPDAGGSPVDFAVGFTAKTISPAILTGTVPGKLDLPKKSYISSSDAQFSVVLTDAQYADVLALTREWGEGGDHRYNLGKRNCVHFVKEAARRSGISVLDFPGLMKKPRSYLLHVAASNPAQVVIIGMPGVSYLSRP
jgi:hypothetical protein